MMITKLKIMNFKCFEDQEVDFSPFTILVGANASGKSSVIQALLLIRQSIEKVFGSYPKVRGMLLTDFGKKYIDKKYDKPFDLLLNGPHLLQLGSAENVISEAAVSRDIKFLIMDNEEQCITFQYDLDSEDSSHLLKGKLVNYNIGRTDCILFGSQFSYLNAERLGPRKALDLGTSSLLDVGSKGEYTTYVIHKADVERTNIHKDLILETQSSRFSSQVEAWLQMIIPDQKIGLHVLPEVTMASIDFNNCTPPNTGFGLSYVLPIITSGLLLSNERNAILIVENPEAHLHPFGQSRIGRFLARLAMVGTQVIIETHSEHVINGARLELALNNCAGSMGVNYFSKGEDKLSIDKISVNEFGELSHWPQGFFDQAQNDLKELFLLKREGKLK